MFFGVFLGPIFAMVLFNTVVFVLVLRVLMKHTIRKSKEAKKKQQLKTTIKAMISIISIMFMFGLQWLFGALTIAEASLAFQWLFVIFSTLQGLFLFIFFCVLGKDAREEWLKLFLRRRQGNFTTTASSKLVSKSLAMSQYGRNMQHIVVSDTGYVGKNISLECSTTAHDTEEFDDGVIEAMTYFTNGEAAISNGKNSLKRSRTLTNGSDNQVPPHILERKFNAELYFVPPSPPHDLLATSLETVEIKENGVNPDISHASPDISHASIGTSSSGVGEDFTLDTQL